MSKPPSQNAIGRALDLSSAAMVKLKKQGCPMDSVESARAWREARLNVAARKPTPAAAVVPSPAAGADSVGGTGMAGFFPANLPPTDMPPWPGVGGSGDRGWDAGSGADPTEDHQAARTRREIAEANLAEMREAEERGDLIRVAAVRSTLAAVFSTTRDALLQLPARLAPLIAADPDPASVQNTLHAEIHQALHDLAGASARVGQAEGLVQ